MSELKFEAVKEGEQKVNKSEKIKKNSLTATQLEKATGGSNPQPEIPKEEIRKAEPVNPEQKKPTNYDRWAGPSPKNEIDV